ncbi:hypothetical protein OS493_039726 [Desmophyllum pertusum]|uniref:Uncharacterized protein n=1 Tax=Desmophyllum pertusum TaxID=174260 RepID=A0A9W9ZY32_9CNID|nr:hypothetical protein OS493_039726 [Desmophyllum pertusum]
MPYLSGSSRSRSISSQVKGGQHTYISQVENVRLQQTRNNRPFRPILKRNTRLQRLSRRTSRSIVRTWKM